MKKENLFLAFNGVDDILITQCARYQSGKKIVKFNKRLSVVACICLILITTITATAAIRHFWGHGLSSYFNATDEQQQTLTEQGQAIVFSEEDDYSKYAITDNGITLTPVAIVADDNKINLTLKYSGVEINEGCEPNINVDDIYIQGYEGDSFGYGMGIRDDEFIFNIDGTDSIDSEMSLTDKTIHLELSDFSIVNSDFSENSLGGTWVFDLPIPEVSNALVIDLNNFIPEFNCEATSFKISPISAEIRYTITDDVKDSWFATPMDKPRVPYITSLTLDDGTVIDCRECDNLNSIDGDNNTAIFSLEFNNIIEPSTVKSIELEDINGNTASIPLH